jgi:hypothetical protein
LPIDLAAAIGGGIRSRSCLLKKQGQSLPKMKTPVRPVVIYYCLLLLQ